MKDSVLKKSDVDIKLITGHFDPSSHQDFALIKLKFADREGLYMQKEALEAFQYMYEAAAKDGVHLKIKSATRNFNYQKGIWESKWTGAKLIDGVINASKKYTDHVERALAILKYSAMPSTSRHHWGSDIDINAFNNSYFESGEGLKVFEWMEENAINFGYCRPYTKKGTDRNSGYQEEKWHWSYMPISNKLTEYAELYLKNENITGFLGSEVAAQIDVVKNYVLGISPSCNGASH